MSLSRHLPIMPKAGKAYAPSRQSTAQPYPLSNTDGARQPGMWTTSEDEILLQARASGLAWQPLRDKHFTKKSANACRKRHERLIEQRRGEDWSPDKLDRLAMEYNAVRKQMWEILAARTGEPWTVVEAKCMEKGIKNLQSLARTAQRKVSSAAASRGSSYDSDSGIGLCPEVEMAITSGKTPLTGTHEGPHYTHEPVGLGPREHTRSRSLPQTVAPLPLYKPPPPPIRHTFDVPMTTSPTLATFCSATGPKAHAISASRGRGGFRIQQVLASSEPQQV